jgi:hypothetical protein
MLGDIAVQNLASFMFDDKEAVQHAERHGGRGEEIAGGENLAMILQKGQPLLIRIAAVHDTPEIAGDGPLGDGETELLQFGVDLGRTPIGILFGQAGDQVPKFLGNSGSASTRSGAPAPIEAEAGAVLSDDGFRLDDEEDIGPARPEAAKRGPKQSVARIQGRPWSLALQYGDLLSKSEDLQGDITVRTEENEECTQYGD